MSVARNEWVWLAALAATGFLFYLLLPVLMPFVVAAALAYLGDPLVARLQRLHLSRGLSVSVVFVLLLCVIAALAFFIIPALAHQVYILGQRLPVLVQWLHDQVFPRLGDTALGSTWDAAAIRQLVTSNWKEASALAANMLQTLSRSGLVFAGLLVKLLIIPFAAFYLMRDWNEIVAHIQDLLPRRWLPTARDLAREMDSVLGAFVRGQLLVMLAQATIYSFGLWALGLDTALLIGTAAGLIEFVPYLGFTLGVLAAGVAVLVQTHDPFQLLWVAVIFTGGNTLANMLLTPWLVGNRIGLHPVAVIFAVLAGGELFGFTGILLALPVAAMIAVLWRFLRERWTDSASYLSAREDSASEGER